MFDTDIFHDAHFSECKSFLTLANKIGYRKCHKWNLPRWEYLKENYPFDKHLGLPNEGFLWTDNSSNSNFTAKKMKLSSGDFIDCNTKEHYNQKAICILVGQNDYNFEANKIYPFESGNFLILPFGKMTYDEVDTMNSILSRSAYMGFSEFRRPSIEILQSIFPIISDLFDSEAESWFWSSSEGGRFKASWLNMKSGEIYACKKAADYSTNTAYSIALVS